MDEQRRKEILAYMEQQWDDIHHSRNQDWKVLVIIVGIFSVLFMLHGREFKGAHTLPLELAVCGRRPPRLRSWRLRRGRALAIIPRQDRRDRAL